MSQNHSLVNRNRLVARVQKHARMTVLFRAPQEGPPAPERQAFNLPAWSVEPKDPAWPIEPESQVEPGLTAAWPAAGSAPIRVIGRVKAALEPSQPNQPAATSLPAAEQPSPNLHQVPEGSTTEQKTWRRLEAIFHRHQEKEALEHVPPAENTTGEPTAVPPLIPPGEQHSAPAGPIQRSSPDSLAATRPSPPDKVPWTPAGLSDAPGQSTGQALPPAAGPEPQTKSPGTGIPPKPESGPLAAAQMPLAPSGISTSAPTWPEARFPAPVSMPGPSFERGPVEGGGAVLAAPSQQVSQTVVEDSAEGEPMRPRLQTLPLQEVWPVQRIQAASRSRLPPQVSVGGEPPEVERELPIQPEITSIEVIPPTHPRPVIEKSITGLPADQPAPTPPAGPPQLEPSAGKDQLVAPDMVATQIGPLPADLWKILGQPLPAREEPSPAQIFPAPEGPPAVQSLPAPEGPPPTPARPGQLGQTNFSATAPPEPETPAPASDPPTAALPARPANMPATTSLPPVAVPPGGLVQRAPADPQAGSGPQPSGPGPAPAPGAAEKDEEQPGPLDLDELARQVYAAIRRRLLAEAERFRR